MRFDKAKLQAISQQLNLILAKLEEMETQYASVIEKIHPVYQRSAGNLIHYLAFRSFDIDLLQDRLRDQGLPSLSNIEGHVKDSILTIKTIVSHLLHENVSGTYQRTISVTESKKLLNRNTKLLFGFKSRKRRTRIMVTLPSTAAEDKQFAYKLLKAGMNSARINCAHDNPEAWSEMIKNLNLAQKSIKKKCKVMMDLGGPKLRTGAMKPGPKVIRIRPQKNALGIVVKPANVWIAPQGVNPPHDEADAIIPVDELWFKKIKRGNIITFIDSRGKKCKIQIERKQGEGRWGVCSDSAYVNTGADLNLQKTKESGEEIVQVGELLPVEEVLLLHPEDTLILHKEPIPGEPAKYDENGNLAEPAHVSCTLPEIFNDVRVGEPIFFDDGKIEGVIEEKHEDHLKVKITYARDTGTKLKADKGINLPESDLQISGLTEKDIQDMQFVAKNADAVNFSFVNTEEDVQELLDVIKELESEIGIILKIETRKGFKNLPGILLTAMQTYPIGVMIARGDLAIETGWKNFASIQEEILRICEAAHIPDVWATQVLENLAKKGVPTRSEITDAAMSQRAECVMLNKGVYIEKAVKMLDRILRRMQRFQKKKETMLPKLDDADQLHLSHEKYDI
ncbi:hypothetical protein EYV94_03645 [Puteibacter caeruleilacunae]|nr:hypothetical protein EYV94_03645 [Puteibacter caeruleilacunae]